MFHSFLKLSSPWPKLSCHALYLWIGQQHEVCFWYKPGQKETYVVYINSLLKTQPNDHTVTKEERNTVSGELSCSSLWFCFYRGGKQTLVGGHKLQLQYSSSSVTESSGHSAITLDSSVTPSSCCEGTKCDSISHSQDTVFSLISVVKCCWTLLIISTC